LGLFQLVVVCSRSCERSTLLLFTVSLYVSNHLMSAYIRGVKHTPRGPNPARCVVGSGPRDDFVK